jgi:hypothetical protein
VRTSNAITAAANAGFSISGWSAQGVGVDPNARLRLLAGKPGVSGFADGTRTAARFTNLIQVGMSPDRTVANILDGCAGRPVVVTPQSLCVSVNAQQNLLAEALRIDRTHNCDHFQSEPLAPLLEFVDHLRGSETSRTPSSHWLSKPSPARRGSVATARCSGMPTREHAKRSSVFLCPGPCAVAGLMVVHCRFGDFGSARWA